MRIEHTPGPWVLVPLDAPRGTLMISASVGGKNPLVCVLEHTKTGPINHAIAGKNADLIAAAPDLLEALKDFSAYVHAANCSTDGPVSYSFGSIHALAFKARAAIAKATGGAA